MSDHPRIRSLIFNRPWAIEPDWLDIIAEVVVQATGELAAGRTVARSPKPSSLRVQDGVPIIEVDGVISKKMNLFSDVSGGTSIEQLSAQFDEAMAMDANAIILNVHSPGGSVDGVREMAQKIFDARSGSKVIVALADNMAASAAYWISAAADEMYVTSGGSVGSIGVVARITDTSRAEKNIGIDSTIIRSSELKAPTAGGPMSPAQQNSVVEQVRQYATMFRGDIKSFRPQVNFDGVDMGQMFIGQKAVDAGLADGITTLNALVKRYAKN